jgi:hypothetical protein
MSFRTYQALHLLLVDPGVILLYMLLVWMLSVGKMQLP